MLSLGNLSMAVQVRYSDSMDMLAVSLHLQIGPLPVVDTDILDRGTH